METVLRASIGGLSGSKSSDRTAFRVFVIVRTESMKRLSLILFVLTKCDHSSELEGTDRPRTMRARIREWSISSKIKAIISKTFGNWSGCRRVRANLGTTDASVRPLDA